jgi:2',3'-cyclic-nucleotide 2'-phosphodiesterase (5'-nucleotidase family)
MGARESVIDASIPDDPSVDALIAPYSAQVHALDNKIGDLAETLKKEGMGGGSIGNFVADALRLSAQNKLGAPVALAVINTGGLRKNEIAAGALTASDIYELLPFENAPVALDLTGDQLRRLLDAVVAKRDAQSGARIIYRTNEEKTDIIIHVGLGDEGIAINPTATYTIATIDYLVKRGGAYSVLQEAKNIRSLGPTLRDLLLDYVKKETAAGRAIKARLDGRYKFDASAATEGVQR